MEKDREWKEKLEKVEQKHQKVAEELTKKLNSAEAEKSSIHKSYESQNAMMSEHIVELNT